MQIKEKHATFNYQIRSLTTDDLKQYNDLLRYSFQVTEQELFDTGWHNDEIIQSKFPVLERADVLGLLLTARPLSLRLRSIPSTPTSTTPSTPSDSSPASVPIRNIPATAS